MSTDTLNHELDWLFDYLFQYGVYLNNTSTGEGTFEVRAWLPELDTYHNITVCGDTLGEFVDNFSSRAKNFDEDRFVVSYFKDRDENELPHSVAVILQYAQKLKERLVIAADLMQRYTENKRMEESFWDSGLPNEALRLIVNSGFGVKTLGGDALMLFRLTRGELPIIHYAKAPNLETFIVTLRSSVRSQEGRNKFHNRFNFLKYGFVRKDVDEHYEYMERFLIELERVLAEQESTKDS